MNNPTLRGKATEYEPKHTQNIADLEVVNVDAEIMEETDVEFPYNYIEVDGVRYRVPTSVLTALKAILEENQELTKIRVKKTGEGMNTKYTVIPLA